MICLTVYNSILLITYLCSYTTALSSPSPRVAIVGGGIGGLVTTGILSYHGYNCTLIDMNKEYGGRCGSKSTSKKTPSKKTIKARFEVGPSLLLLPSVYTDCANAMGSSCEQLKWDIKECPSPTYGLGYDDGTWETLGGSSTVPNSMDRWVEVNDFMLRLGLPFFIEGDLSKVEWGRFLRDVRGLVKAVFRDGYNPFEDMGNVVKRMGGGKKTNLASTFQVLYVGLTPTGPGSVLKTVAPALFGLLSSMELLGSQRDEGGRKIHGVHYVEGGFGTIIDGIVNLLKSRGVLFRPGVKVSKIEPRKDGGRGAEVDGEAFDAVVCNVDVAGALENRLVRTRENTRRLTEEGIVMSPSVLQFHWILEGEEAKRKLRAHNVFLSDDEVGSWDAVRAGDKSVSVNLQNSKVRPPPFNFYVHNPGCGDDTACVGGGTVLMALIPIASGTKVTEEEVNKWEGWVKERVERRTGPIRVIYSKCTTPEMWERKYGLKGGAVFGASHGLGQLGPTRQGCEVEGLRGAFWVGASKRPGNGVPLVMIGAEKTAREVVKFLEGS